MIFDEIYSAYYNSVAKIIIAIINEKTEEQDFNQIVYDNAFGESMLTVLPSLKSEKWQLVRSDMTTPIIHKPTMPLTLIQKQWLKAISLDPRIKLFGVEINGLEDTEPLFTSSDYFVYDKYNDGDPYEDDGYITRFGIILSAIKSKQPLRIEYVNRRGSIIKTNVLPLRLEYSEKDDKFRLISAGCRYGNTVNLARIISCERCSDIGFKSQLDSAPIKKTVTLRIVNKRNALERCMLHFAHFEKQAEQIDEKHYLVRIRYDMNDEIEMVIRVLGFGPLIEVIEPDDFRKLIIDRLQKQKSCELS